MSCVVENCILILVNVSEKVHPLVYLEQVNLVDKFTIMSFSSGDFPGGVAMTMSESCMTVGSSTSSHVSQRSSVPESEDGLILSLPKLSRSPTSILYNRNRMRLSNSSPIPVNSSNKVSCICKIMRTMF